MSTGPGRCRYTRYRAALLSFEGPSTEALRRPASAELENCTEPKKGLNTHRRARERGAVLTVKIVRASGGCLGTRSRRRTWTAAISRGEALNSL
jgi:hypothetical protein